ncbi:MAG: tyrosine-type recombinase/integrase [Rhodospirillaceae bacterium]|nr:tyrosine-type recombinase/integrase [Rhodospirillaceae bacterium]
MATEKHNADNERLKRRYFAYLREAKGLSEASIDKAAAAIDRFEGYTKRRGFDRFHIQQAIAFKAHLLEQRHARSGERLSAATLHGTLATLRAFFVWLADQPGFRTRIRYADAEYFSLSDRETRIAKTKRESPVPTLEQVRAALAAMPADTDIARRDRALIAFALLTGARDGAIASLKIKHVDIAHRRIVQDAREVATKRGKTITTWFFPVGEDTEQMVVDWVRHLTDDLLFGPSDPLFPATQVAVGSSGGFEAVGISRTHWSNAGPIRRIFRDAFAAVGLPNFTPHSFRKTLAMLGERLCRTPEEFKAWSQNLGHDQVLTTFTSYGTIPAHRQAELIRSIGRDDAPGDVETLKRKLQALLNR